MVVEIERRRLRLDWIDNLRRLSRDPIGIAFLRPRHRPAHRQQAYGDILQVVDCIRPVMTKATKVASRLEGGRF